FNLLLGEGEEWATTVSQPVEGKAGQLFGGREDVDLDQGTDRLVDSSLHALRTFQVTASQELACCDEELDLQPDRGPDRALCAGGDRGGEDLVEPSDVRLVRESLAHTFQVEHVVRGVLHPDDSVIR